MTQPQLEPSSRQGWTFESKRRWDAFLLGLHPRVGAHSRVRGLPEELLARVAACCLVPRVPDTVRAR